MITCTRSIEFDAGHRVVGHGSKCKHLHGHRYKVEITCALIAGTDKLGMVVDFGLVKELVGGWIDDHLDHGLILWDLDPLFKTFWSMRVDGPALRATSADVEDYGTTPQKLYSMRVNPTAENLAAHLLEVATDLLPPEVKPLRVRVYETPNCWADSTVHSSEVVSLEDDR